MTEVCKHEYECVGNFVLTSNPPILGENYRCHKCGVVKSIQYPRSFSKPKYFSEEDLNKLTK